MMVIFVYVHWPFLYFLMKSPFGYFAFVKIWVIYLFIIEFYIHWVIFMYSCTYVYTHTCTHTHIYISHIYIYITYIYIYLSSIICKNFFSMCGIWYFYLLNCISQLCTNGHQLYITQKALEAVFPNTGAVLTLRGILSSSQVYWLQLLLVLV